MLDLIKATLGIAVVIPLWFLFSAKMSIRERMISAPFVIGWCVLVTLAIAGVNALSDPLTRYMMFYGH